MAEIHTTKQC